jgi:hypothetical protein
MGVFDMQYGLHRHNFEGKTTFNYGHIHGYCGTTSTDPDFIGHVHLAAGVTTLNDGHIHGYEIETSPGIPVEGGHIHYYRVATFYNNGHIHYMCGYTGRGY